LVGAEERVRVNGRYLTISNLDKILWPDDQVRKAELIEYYAEVGQYMIPYIRDRPIMVRRYPHGITDKSFVQKHFVDVPSWVRRFSFKSAEYVLCNDVPTLIWLANLAALEINQMLARVPKIRKHDIVLIDLDPHPPAAFDDARVAARGVATLLEKLNVEFLMKTSGADGIHFFIPIKPTYSVEKIRRFVYAIGRLVETADPKLATVSTKAERKRGHVYVDFLQNALEKTITAPLSTRALPHAPVSYPLTVKQLYSSKSGPLDFTVRKAPRRSSALRHMLRVSKLAQDLKPGMAKLNI
jgi:bifunctional non-homologous end joining protein LigD